MAQNTKVSADANAPPVTQILADFVTRHPSQGWDASVDREAHRTLLNWVGCAIGASQHATVKAALAAVLELAPAAQATILGRVEQVDVASAALLNGITSHTFDFDDTHLKTIIHPAGPVASALLALAEHYGATGRQFIDALVLGIDVECRVGNMIYPEHYDRGWHITGSTGMLGAAAACARLLGLDAGKTAMALGIAASQPIGVREQFGSMTKPFHIGGAARAGLMSALMAKHGYTASGRAIEAPRGLAQTYSTKCDWKEITGELGKRFEISFNTYKPFACGIVIHPSIDGCVQLSSANRLPVNDIERIDLKVHSLVLELTGKTAPRNGLEAKFSVYHACAAGIVFGEVGEHAFSDEVVARADVIALRDRIRASVDDGIDEDSADVTITCRDGRKLHVFVEHAIGSVQRPMSDAELRRKFHGLVDPVLGNARAERLIEQCVTLSGDADVRALTASARASAEALAAE
ncbi:MAG TPA: MmgE/PrpD family protein [Casimicrobiaceae bacterium]|jgi:2-methylcitrate dehydratase PrpD|nr:MmgE/PrpD family protein [Casimicrobiaceae bacterium]